MNFDQANQTVHAIEDQWHYPILTRYGFVPQNKQAIGFVRRYQYSNAAGQSITMVTGASSDYWETKSAMGYHHQIIAHLKYLTARQSNNNEITPQQP